LNIIHQVNTEQHDSDIAVKNGKVSAYWKTNIRWWLESVLQDGLSCNDESSDIKIFGKGGQHHSSLMNHCEWWKANHHGCCHASSLQNANWLRFLYKKTKEIGNGESEYKQDDIVEWENLVTIFSLTVRSWNITWNTNACKQHDAKNCYSPCVIATTFNFWQIKFSTRDKCDYDCGQNELNWNDTKDFIDKV